MTMEYKNIFKKSIGHCDIGYILHLSDNSIYRVDLGDLDITSIKYIAPSFDDFLGKAIYLNFNKLQNVANNNLTT